METFSRELLSTLGALVFVALLAWVCIGLMKRMQQGRAGPAGAASELRFIRALPVGAKERVVVLQYRGEEWVVGVATGGVTLLSRQPLEGTARPSAAMDTPSTPGV